MVDRFVGEIEPRVGDLLDIANHSERVVFRRHWQLTCLFLDKVRCRDIFFTSWRPFSRLQGCSPRCCSAAHSSFQLHGSRPGSMSFNRFSSRMEPGSGTSQPLPWAGRAVMVAVGGEEKQARHFGPSTLRAPFGPPTLWALHASAPHPSGPSC